MPRRNRDQDIIILKQEGESSLKWLFVGSLLGAGLALLLAPATGEETREQLVRKARKIRLSAEDAIDEIQERFDAFRGNDVDDDELEEALDDELDEGDEDEEEEETVEEADAVTAVPRTRVRGRKARKKKTGISEAREELEHRLEAARARRRQSSAEDEEPDV